MGGKLRVRTCPVTPTSMAAVDVRTEDAPAVKDTKMALLTLGVTTCRGEFASEEDKAELRRLVDKLLAANGDGVSPRAQFEGSWDLIMSNTHLFRSSPFFMAGRSLLSGESQVAKFNEWCDLHRAALAFSQIGRVRQIVGDEQLRSEFQVKAGLSTLFFGFPVVVKGWIVTTADVLSPKDARKDSGVAQDDVEENGNMCRLAVRSVQVKESNVPYLRDALDTWLQLPIQSLSSLLRNTPFNVERWRPEPVLRTWYLDETMRVSVDQDDNIFVYVRS